MDEKLNKITIDFLEMLNGINLEDIEQIKAEWLNELADKKSKFKDYESAKNYVNAVCDVAITRAKKKQAVA